MAEYVAVATQLQMVWEYPNGIGSRRLDQGGPVESQERIVDWGQLLSILGTLPDLLDQVFNFIFHCQ